MDYRQIDARDRRLIIVASPERVKKMDQNINWDGISASLPLAASSTAWASMSAGLLLPLIPGMGLLTAAKYIAPIFGPYLLRKIKKRALPYPVMDLRIVRDQFRFPMNHPVDGIAYGCCEAEPNLYVPISAFHKYMYEAKMAAFQELCANLGAHRCSVTYAEENGQDITADVGVRGIPTPFGRVDSKVSGGRSKRSGSKAAVFMEYPKTKLPATATNSGWMHGEPTWVSMQKLRMERKNEKYTAEFTYRDEMGVNANVAAAIADIGIDTGGKFQEMHDRKWIFEVEFWPMK